MKSRDRVINKPLTRQEYKFRITPPDEAIINMMEKKIPVVPRLFAQTSSYWRSQAYLTCFLQANHSETQKNILIDLYINHKILMKAESLLAAWVHHLYDYRKYRACITTNHLLTTALLILIQEKYPGDPSLIMEFKSPLKEELNTLLYLQSKENPQLANSILAVLAKATNKHDIYATCKEKHNINDILFNERYWMSINDMKLFIQPFIDIYAKENYFRPVTQELSSDIRELHYFYAIHAILKLMPDNHELFTKAPGSIKNFMFRLHTPNLADYITEATDIILTIQSRVKNKDFLMDYHKASKKDYGEKDTLVKILEQANYQLVTDEELIIEHLESHYYSKLTNLPVDQPHFFPTLAKLARKLSLEKNIINAIENIFPLLNKSDISWNAMYNILNILLPKIHSQSFYITYFQKLFALEIEHPREYIIDDLSNVCSQHKLQKNTIYQVANQFFIDLEKKPGSPLVYKLLPSLCCNIYSKQHINHLIKKINNSHSTMEANSIEWFKDEKNFMYFECYLHLLTKTYPSQELIQVYLDKLFTFLDDTVLVKKATNLGLKLCLMIRSEESIIKWITKFSTMNILHFQTVRNITQLVLCIKDKDTIMKCINILKINLATSSSIHDSLSFLLHNLPAQFSKEISTMILSVMKEQNTTDENIKNYIEQAEQGNSMELSHGI